jgi:hypothetical protein
MPGFGPLGSAPVASIGADYTAAAGKLIFTGSNSTSNQNFPNPGRLIFGGGQAITFTAYPHVSWIGVEALHAGAANWRESWIGVEVLRTVATAPTANLVTWIGLEVAHVGAAAERVSWLGVEALHVGAAYARTSWMGVEVLRTTSAAVSRSQVTWIGVEVLRTVKDQATDSGWVCLIAA